jgi:hypothetical protein
MSREPLYAIVYTADGLEIVEAAAVSRRVSLMKRKHAEAVLVKLQADGIDHHVREAFGPGEVIA